MIVRGECDPKNVRIIELLEYFQEYRMLLEHEHRYLEAMISHNGKVVIDIRPKLSKDQLFQLSIDLAKFGVAITELPPPDNEDGGSFSLL